MKLNFKEIGLLPKILVAIITGVLLGFVAPEFLVRLFSTFNSLFSNILSFSIPLIILGLVVGGISELGKNSGKLLTLTVALAYISTVFSGLITYLSCYLVFPYIINSQNSASSAINSSVEMATNPYFSIGIPPMFDVMTALVLSFLIGIGISFSNGIYLKNVFSEFKVIIEKFITFVIIPMLPIYIFGIFLNMSFSGDAFEIMSIFGKVIILIILLSFVLLIIQFVIAGFVTSQNPFKSLKNMLPAYITALGTASSAATIPVTLKQTIKNNVSEGVAGFCVPLCATIHLSGSTMKITGMALAIMYYESLPVDFITFLGFILMIGVTMVAAPGVPGGAIMAAVAVLQSVLGFNEQNIALMIAVYVAIDSFGTACNVTGDGAISMIVNKVAGKTVKSE